MNSCFDKLCKEIHFKKTQNFNDVKVIKASLEKDDIFKINFSTNKIIPFSEMNSFICALNNNFKYKTKFNFQVLSPIYEKENIKQYLNWIISEYMENSSLSKNILESIENINKECEILIICNNEYSMKKINDSKKKIIRILKKFGFKDAKFNIQFKKNKILENAKKDLINDIKQNYEKLMEKKDFYISNKNNYNYQKSNIYDLHNNEGFNRVQVKGEIFFKEIKETKSNTKIFIFTITDYKECIYLKAFVSKSNDFSLYNKFHEGDCVLVNGILQMDAYSKQKIIVINKIKKINAIKKEKIIDDAQEKRVELSIRSRMSTMDGIVSPKQIIQKALQWNHKAIAIVDSESVQSFPDFFNAAKNTGVKPIYGATFNVIPKESKSIYHHIDRNLMDDEYVIFDLETTGFSPEYNDLIEFGAVIIKNNQVITNKQFFIKPSKSIPEKITMLTKITNDDVKNAKSEKDAMKEIIDFIGNKTLVAHNANFDLTFLKNKAKKYNLREINNPTIDTLITSRIIFPNSKKFKLETIAKKYDVKYDSNVSHRADYDAEVLANIWTKQIMDLKEKKIHNQKELFDYIDCKLYDKAFYHEITILAKNQKGLKELFEIISFSLIDNLHNGGRIFLEDLKKYKNILIGSGALKSKLIDLMFTGSKDQIIKEIAKYDYIEIQPIQNFVHKINESFNLKNLHDVIKFVIDESKKQKKIVVATGDCRYLEEHQKIYHEIYINSKGLGGVRHYLFNYNDDQKIYPNQIILTTEQMKKQFSFLKDEKIIDEIVVKNSNYIADMIDEIKIIKKGLFTPKLDGVDEKLKNLIYSEATKRYGNPLPEIIEKRLQKEIDPIQKYGFSVIYWISHLLVTKSLKDGYLVGSRGSVGSSLVAHLANITEVNPLDPHYLCTKCKYSEFFIKSSLNSGYDLKDKKCPKCNVFLTKEGQKIPFETFLGFEGNKVPDIDLNFSGEYQPFIHKEVKNIFGDTHSFRAGTISTVAEKTAFGYAKTWAKETNKNISKPFLEFLAKGVTGTKRTTGQHPGGIIVIPKDKDVEDFSPINYPANDKNSQWKTTHFDFHAIHDNVLKLDLLGHDDPTAIKYLEKLTGINAKKDIPFSDEKVISIFSSTNALNIKPEDIGGEKTGAMGIPEFGTTFVRRMLKSAKVSSFADLVAVSGLSHGTNVWTDNAQNIIKEHNKKLSEVISCRDNIMTDLIEKGIESSHAFEIMERIRKGMGLTSNQEKILIDNKIENWYIESLKKIKYMFPKAHATAYVMMAWRIAWFKVYKPEAYYATYFTTRADVFDILSISKGRNYTIQKIKELKQRKRNKKENPLSNREVALIPILELTNEAFARNIKIKNIDLEKSQANCWIIDDKNNLIPPFISLEGLGEAVANSIIKAREENPFKSIEDFSKRTLINKTNLEELKKLEVLKHLSDEDQISIMDLL